MKRILFNDGWTVQKGTLADRLEGKAEKEKKVVLPYDAMIHEHTCEQTENGPRTGFYPGGEYTYKKKFAVPEEWRGKSVSLFFGGVYNTALVRMNGNFVCENLYGYGEFYAEIGKYLRYGQMNEVTVVANNLSEPNSRWYSGSGIFRSVELLVGGSVHIGEDGVRVITREASADGALIEIETGVRNITGEKHRVQLHTEVIFEGSIIKEDTVWATLFGGETEKLRQNLYLKEARLWSDENPALHEIRVSVSEDGSLLDSETVKTGFRTLHLDADRGLRVNDKPVKLRGACIHHDNGILGAATFPAAERKRARELKAAGFNAIRSAHMPIGRDMLAACDEYGIFVMDELTDTWNDEKNALDFSHLFSRCWEEEVEKMVRKDFNHPSVIIYSTGNEILELGQENGGAWNRRICGKFHRLDPSRFTTTGCSGFNAVVFSGRLPLILADIQRKMKTEETQASKPDSGGGNAQSGQEASADGVAALNSLMSQINGPAFSCHPLVTETLEEAAQAADICGYNYCLDRHIMEKELHPNKPLLATESFPAQITALWKVVEDYPHVLGDFTWTGYDYIGEAGCGVFCYDGERSFGTHYPDRLSCCGDINLIGYRRPVSYLREIVFGRRKAPYLAVIRLNRYGQRHNESQWLFKDNVSSWTWPGFEGKETEVDIYSADEEAELFLNGKSLGRKKCGREYGYTATWKVIYEPGTLTAVSYQRNKETGRSELRTAGEQIILSPMIDRKEIAADGQDIAFITCRLTDDAGTPNLFAKKRISVKTEGVGVLQGFGSADPQPLSNYFDTEWETYDGEVMAAVRSNGEEGEIRVTFEAGGCAPVTAVMEAKGGPAANGI
ncbi:MAG: DUF4982 domain-containing protein [Lachnospiraceae bacterium]|nr:DUF4982 domain-containing protein [Lachnospiraceae bacterium]